MQERGVCFVTANRIMKKPDTDSAFPDVPDEDVRSFFAALEWMYSAIALRPFFYSDDSV